MDKITIQQRFLEKLRNFRPAKWGASHTELRNIFKGIPKHLIGRKEVQDALHELFDNQFILKWKKTNEIHISLNPQKKQEIELFLEKE